MHSNVWLLTLFCTSQSTNPFFLSSILAVKISSHKMNKWGIPGWLLYIVLSLTTEICSQGHRLIHFMNYYILEGNQFLFHSQWDTVRKSVCKFNTYLWMILRILMKINQSVLVLILKLDMDATLLTIKNCCILIQVS